MSNSLVILDRDGVINYDSDSYIKSPDEWQAIPGSIEAIARLSRAGKIICVATNQSGLARGLFDEITLANIHAYMSHLVEEAGGQIDAIFFCPHGPDDGCHCRKPETGMLEQIKSEFGLELKGSYFVGDSEKDIDAALTCDCQPILVRTGNGRLTEQNLDSDKKQKVLITDTLNSAAEIILG
ncbi:MAG: D-glycero-beta-D-manno-heptose-1,7-bisphosphate 7-phosphatase [Gammaproteobacteria bacterium]|nr:D-glycero-beta-D-manno-heptose-1,7-bisphosphate 7-phosphatase [Gammaproteobacteria bacterium]MAY02929.1 D-glycero-beta-D-manno-heptose-1,7-bisphosphate 7-phosphatase [Gammaproteobacteria bacterium]|tara:strand:+ start:205 stop:750 length:546 start_codon:yes stop_codon:yes gene_type:complete